MHNKLGQADRGRVHSAARLQLLPSITVISASIGPIRARNTQGLGLIVHTVKTHRGEEVGEGGDDAMLRAFRGGGVGGGGSDGWRLDFLPNDLRKGEEERMFPL